MKTANVGLIWRHGGDGEQSRDDEGVILERQLKVIDERVRDENAELCSEVSEEEVKRLQRGSFEQLAKYDALITREREREAKVGTLRVRIAVWRGEHSCAIVARCTNTVKTYLYIHCKYKVCIPH